MTADPIQQFKLALANAEGSGIDLANGMCLSTVDSNGHPTSRIVLLKDVDENGFVFYTNMESPKGRDLASAPHAALCFWWNPLQQQVCVRGHVTVVDDREADAYFATRPRGSQIGAWASHQSAVLASREALETAAEEAARKYEGQEIPRPPYWSGYVLNPTHIEFWYGREDRLHERQMFTRTHDGGWSQSLLNP